jgi:hypothetical protein
MQGPWQRSATTLHAHVLQVLYRQERPEQGKNLSALQEQIQRKRRCEASYLELLMKRDSHKFILIPV